MSLLCGLLICGCLACCLLFVLVCVFRVVFVVCALCCCLVFVFVCLISLVFVCVLIVLFFMLFCLLFIIICFYLFDVFACVSWFLGYVRLLVFDLFGLLFGWCLLFGCWLFLICVVGILFVLQVSWFWGFVYFGLDFCLLVCVMCFFACVCG